MAWPSSDHLDNLEELLRRLHWLIQPDTVLTELPHDLEFISQTDLERFTDWCQGSVSKSELQKGSYTINPALIDFFIKSTCPDLSMAHRKNRVDAMIHELHALLGIPEHTAVNLDTKTIEKLFVIVNERPGENHFEKTVKKIKVGVALKWLQDDDLLKKLSDETSTYIKQLGDCYGSVKRGEEVRVSEIGTYNPPEDDKLLIIEDFMRKVELTLMEASQELTNVKNNPATDDEFGSFRSIIGIIKRLETYVNGKNIGNYDYIEQFRDIIFIVIILNYIQDPYIKRRREAANLLKYALPVYQKYLQTERKS